MLNCVLFTSLDTLFIVIPYHLSQKKIFKYIFVSEWEKALFMLMGLPNLVVCVKQWIMSSIERMYIARFIILKYAFRFFKRTANKCFDVCFNNAGSDFITQKKNIIEDVLIFYNTEVVIRFYLFIRNHSLHLRDWYMEREKWVHWIEKNE